MKTIAEKIARMLGDDGTVWETADGRRLEDVAIEHGAFKENKIHLTRYEFPDGSAIVASEAAWDLEGSTPWSWAGEEEWSVVSTTDDESTD